MITKLSSPKLDYNSACTKICVSGRGINASTATFEFKE